VGFKGVYKPMKFGRKRRTKGKARAKKQSPLQLRRYLSPFVNGEFPPALASIGLFLTVTDQRRLQVTHAAGSGDLVMIFSPSVGGAINCHAWIGTGVSKTDFLTDLSTTYPYRIGGNKQAPVSFRPFRAAVRCQNLSPATARQGSVHVLNSSSPISIDWLSSTTYDVSTLTLQGLISSVLSNPRQRTYTSEQLAVGGASVIAYPTSQSAYNGWCPSGFAASTSTHEAQHTAWSEGEKWQPMSTIMLVFPAVAADQVYEITTCLQSGQRHHPASTLGGLQKNHTSAGNASLIASATTAVASDPSALTPDAPMS
jgi:hypothetical protein